MRVVAVAAWFNRHDNADDVPTGEIAAHLIAAADTSGQDVQRLRDDRAALIQLCLYALDRARSDGVVARIEEGLAGVGVSALRPDGELFDPARHEAGGAVSTSDASLAGTVAETELVGFRDGDMLLRAPVVTVYTAGTTA
ncbi:MAG: nucleotide exchange factor GrpE [Actinophytocola sp.]|nr:nucleotide exchange factor GrpE [Actinophytocola sp.]